MAVKAAQNEQYVMIPEATHARDKNFSTGRYSVLHQSGFRENPSIGSAAFEAIDIRTSDRQ